jgi:hypothetical protein
MAKSKWTKKNHTRTMDQAIEAALHEAGPGLQGQAMELAPVLTGRLAGSITYAVKGFISPADDDPKSKWKSRVKKPGPGATASDRVSEPTQKHVLYLGTNVEYATDVEYGTGEWGWGGGMEPQSFLRYTLDVFRDDLPKLLWKSIKKYYGKPY